ncbi:hypothetical protein KY285_019710 [Solanum tuberosum]|nr:hypothetical protein KY285_019710 [Solanum tuberosum]
MGLNRGTLGFGLGGKTEKRFGTSDLRGRTNEQGDYDTWMILVRRGHREMEREHELLREMGRVRDLGLLCCGEEERLQCSGFGSRTLVAVLEIEEYGSGSFFGIIGCMY